MARIEIASQAWGYLESNAVPLANTAATLKNLDGSNATHWSAVTGGTSSTASMTSDSIGVLAGRFVESGTYTLTVLTTTRRVEAVSGSVEGDIAAHAFLVPAATGVAATDTAAIQAQIDAAATAGGGTVGLRSGTYVTNATLNMKTGVLLVGRGRRVTAIQPNAQTFAAITATGTITDWRVSDLKIDYGVATGLARSANTAAVGIKLVVSAGLYPYFFQIERVSVFYAYRGFHNTTRSFLFELNHFYCSEIGNIGVVSDDAVGSTLTTLRHCYVNGANTGGFDLRRIDGLAMQNCAVDNTGAASGVSLVYIETSRGSIDGLFCEANTIKSYKAVIHFAGCQMRMNAYKSVGNSFTPAAAEESYGIRISDGSRVTVSNPKNDSDTRTGGAGSSTFAFLANTTAVSAVLEHPALTAPGGSGGSTFGVYSTAVLTLIDTVSRRPSYTVATRPAAASYTGGLIYVSDGGAGAVVQASNGTAWVNLG